MKKKTKIIVMVMLSIFLYVIFSIIGNKTDDISFSEKVPIVATVLLIYLNFIHVLIKGRKNILVAEDSFLEVLMILTSFVVILYDIDVFLSSNQNFFTYISIAIVVLLFLWKKWFSEYSEDKKISEKLYLYYNYAVVSFLTLVLL